MIVRAMREDDAPEIIAMARALAAAVDDPEPPLTTTELIAIGFGPERWFDCLVVESERRVVGYALYGRAFEAHTAQKRLWLGDLYVRPEAQRAGAGRALMVAVARRALDLGCDNLYWELWHLNDVARAFYAELGANMENGLAILRLDRSRLVALANRS